MKKLTLEDLTKEELMFLCRKRCFPALVEKDLAVAKFMTAVKKSQKLLEEEQYYQADKFVIKANRIRKQFNI